MTELEIKSRNEAIAVYMGFPLTSSMLNFSDQTERIESIRLLYHADWNWLMPVVEKIKNEHGLNNGIKSALLNVNKETLFYYVSDFCLNQVK